MKTDSERTPGPSEPLFPGTELPRLRKRISNWFPKNGRDLPWRHTRDPYAVWVSEIMLQQTTTETVRGYFARFMARFPTAAALARAEVSEVLRYWEGLGYYRRARLMHKTAGIVVERFGGKFPESREEIASLPGVGRYTTGAILSFALGRREPILEANTTRLHARILALEGSPTGADRAKVLWDFAERILPNRNPGLFNQALIDLGRTVCLPRSPLCAECPCAPSCRAFAEGRQAEIPPSRPKPKTEYRTEAAYLVHLSSVTGKKTDAGRLLFLQYQEGLRWAGLWDFPRFLMDSPFLGEIPRGLEILLGNGLSATGEPVAETSHAVTRYRIRLVLLDTNGYADGGTLTGMPSADGAKGEEARMVEFAGGTACATSLEYQWLSPEDAEGIPLSSTGRKLVKFLRKSGTESREKRQCP